MPSKGQKAEIDGIQRGVGGQKSGQNRNKWNPTRRWRTKKRQNPKIVESKEELEDKKAPKTEKVESKEALEDKKTPKSRKSGINRGV